jgi:hypothetical protein
MRNWLSKKRSYYNQAESKKHFPGQARLRIETKGFSSMYDGDSYQAGLPLFQNPEEQKIQ